MFANASTELKNLSSRTPPNVMCFVTLENGRTYATLDAKKKAASNLENAKAYLDKCIWIKRN